MSEDLNQAVPDTSATEAVPPVTAADSNDPVAMRNKLDLMRRDRQAERDRVRELEKQIKEQNERMQQLQSGFAKQDQERMVKNQEFEALWKLQESNSKMQNDLDSKDQEIARLKAEAQANQVRHIAMDAITQNGAVNPSQVFDLMQKDLRMTDEGKVIVLHGGVEVDLNTHIQNNLKQPGSGWEHQFAGHRRSWDECGWFWFKFPWL